MKNILYICSSNIIFKACKTIKIFTELLFGYNLPLHALWVVSEGSFRFSPCIIRFCTVCFVRQKQCIEHKHKSTEVKTCAVFDFTTGQPIMKMTSMYGQYRGVQMFIDSSGLIEAALPYKDILWGEKVLWD